MDLKIDDYRGKTKFTLEVSDPKTGKSDYYEGKTISNFKHEKTKISKNKFIELRAEANKKKVKHFLSKEEIAEIKKLLKKNIAYGKRTAYLAAIAKKFNVEQNCIEDIKYGSRHQ